MAIEAGKIQIGNMNSFNNSYRMKNVSFTGESKPINNDTVEISTQDKKDCQMVQKLQLFSAL